MTETQVTMCAFCKEVPAIMDSPVACGPCFIGFIGTFNAVVSARVAREMGPTCATCDDLGWIVGEDHAPECWGKCERHGCPVQVQVRCPDCASPSDIQSHAPEGGDE